MLSGNINSDKIEVRCVDILNDQGINFVVGHEWRV